MTSWDDTECDYARRLLESSAVHQEAFLKRALKTLNIVTGPKRSRDNLIESPFKRIREYIDAKNAPLVDDLLHFRSREKIEFLWRGEVVGQTIRNFFFVNEKQYDYEWFHDIWVDYLSVKIDGHYMEPDDIIWNFITYHPLDQSATYITRPEYDDGDEIDDEAYIDILGANQELQAELRERGHVYGFTPIAHQGVYIFEPDKYFKVIDREFFTASDIVNIMIDRELEDMTHNIDVYPAWMQKRILQK